MHPYPPTTVEHEEAVLTALYLVRNDVGSHEVYVTLVDELGVSPHAALTIVAEAA